MTELQQKLVRFYQHPNHVQKFFEIHPVITGVSIRTIHFYFEQYCFVNHPLIYSKWEAEFKRYKKSCFDFYARGEEKVLLVNPKQVVVESTWSQLNFFKWLIENQDCFPQAKETFKKVIQAQKVFQKILKKEGTFT